MNQAPTVSTRQMRVIISTSWFPTQHTTSSHHPASTSREPTRHLMERLHDKPIKGAQPSDPRKNHTGNSKNTHLGVLGAVQTLVPLQIPDEVRESPASTAQENVP